MQHIVFVFGQHFGKFRHCVFIAQGTDLFCDFLLVRRVCGRRFLYFVNFTKLSQLLSAIQQLTAITPKRRFTVKNCVKITSRNLGSIFKT